jgi:hypothetical protein
MQWIWS